MARISTYSTEKPVTGDLVIGTDVGASDGTKNFKVEEIAALAGTGALVNLEQVLTAGNTATNNMQLTGTIIQPTGDHTLTAGNLSVAAGYLSVAGILKDGAGGAGTAGQVLSSTATGVSWIDHSALGPSLSEVLAVGNAANDIGIAFTGTGNTTFSLGQTINSLAPNVWQGTNGFSNNGNTAGTSGINLTGSLSDGTGTGTTGQTLQSTNTGVSWVDGQQQVTTAISSAQILALTGAPVTVVAGVAGKHIVPQQVVVKYIFGTAAYTTTNVGLLFLGAISSLQIAEVFSSSILTGGLTKTFLNSPNPSATLGADYTPEYNTSTGGDDLLFGWSTLNPINGDGTLSVTVIYTLIDA